MHVIFACKFYGPATECTIKDAENPDVKCDEYDEYSLDGKNTLEECWHLLK